MSEETAAGIYQKLTGEEREAVDRIRTEAGCIMLSMNHPIIRGEAGATFGIDLPWQILINPAATGYLLEVYKLERDGTRIVPSIKGNTLELLCEKAVPA